MALAEVGECILDTDQLRLSHGFEGLDPIGREAFVNHLHLSAADRIAAAERIIRAWVAEMKARWPDREFRIYRHVEAHEVTIRFHMVRAGQSNWCEDGIELLIVGRQMPERDPTRDPAHMTAFRGE